MDIERIDWWTKERLEAGLLTPEEALCKIKIKNNLDKLFKKAFQDMFMTGYSEIKIPNMEVDFLRPDPRTINPDEYEK